MWERLTEDARRAVYGAQEEAQRLGDKIISTEYLLLGTIRNGDNEASRILAALGVESERVRADFERMRSPSDEAPQIHEFVLAASGKQAIDFAYEEACDLGCGYLDTGHLLLGLIREGDGLAARVLAWRGVDLQRVRCEAAASAGESRRIVQTPVPMGFVDRIVDRLRRKSRPSR